MFLREELPQTCLLVFSASALFDLADVLLQARAWAPARDAYAIAAPRIERFEEQLLSYGGLAYANAMLGNAAAFRRWSQALDRQGAADAAAPTRAHILYLLGLSHTAIGDQAEARRLLQLVVAEAEAHELNKLLFQAEAALKKLDEVARTRDVEKASLESSALEDPRFAEVSTGLGRMCAELAGAADTPQA